MTGWITPRQFHEAEGVDDWRVLAGGVCAHFVTDSFAKGIALSARLTTRSGTHPPRLRSICGKAA